MDGELRFEAHVSQKIQVAFFRLKALYGIRNFLKEDIRVILTESLVLSVFNYCDTVYGPRLYEKTKNAIQRVQNACARFCFGIPKRSHITPYLNEKLILRMEGRRELHLTGFVQRVVHNKRPKYLYEKIYWSGESLNVNTRSKSRQQISIPRHKTKNYKCSWKIAAAKIWNDLPAPVQKIISKYTFKKKVKTILLDKQKAAALYIYVNKPKKRNGQEGIRLW